MRRLPLVLAVGLTLLARPVEAAVPTDRLTDAQWAQTLAAAGQWVDLQVALEVLFAESGGNPLARNPSGARGAWQFMPNALPDDNCAYDPVCSTADAYRTSSGGTNWSKWEAYTSGAYMGQAARARAAILAAGQAPGPQPQPGPALPSLPPPKAQNYAGMGIDGMVPQPPIRYGNQPLVYERYSPADYGLSVDMVELAKSTVASLFGFTDPSTAATNVLLNSAAGVGMALLVVVGTIATRGLAWSLHVDLLAGADGPLNSMVGGLGHGLYEPLMPLLLTVFLAWLIWTWLFRRRTMRGATGIGWMFGALTLASFYFAAPSQMLDGASSITAGISRSILGAVAGADVQVAHRSDPTVSQGPAEDAELRLFSDRFWTVYVYQPWTVAEFGAFDPKGASGQPLGVEKLDQLTGRPNQFQADLDQQPQEVKDWYNGAQGGNRLVVVSVALLVAIAAGLVFLAAAVVRLAASLVFLALLMVLPLFLLLALHPTVGRKLLVRWLELAIGALWRQVFYSLVLAVMVVLVGVISAAASVGGWGLVVLAQLAAMAGFLIFRKPLLAIFGQLGGSRHRVEHIGASRTAQLAHAGVGTVRQRYPIPSFARAPQRASGGSGGGPRRVASVAAAAETAGTAAVGVATGGWGVLLKAAAAKGGQVAIRRGEAAKRQLQGGAGAFLVDGKAGAPLPRRMPEKPLGAHRAAVRTAAWNRVRRRPYDGQGGVLEASEDVSLKPLVSGRDGNRRGGRVESNSPSQHTPEV
ncbi:MAG: type IV secretion system protein [Candidatus Dormibacteraeota bacterium]|nr:type IV secretion system protein [Candidatus Dormibacteraeota bacterium]